MLVTPDVREGWVRAEQAIVNTMSPEICRARQVSARCWLKDCDIKFEEIHWATMVIILDAGTIYWLPRINQWAYFPVVRSAWAAHFGNQPEFAVFLRQVREGRLAA